MTTTQLPLIERKEITLSCLSGDEIVHVLTTARVCGYLAIHKSVGGPKRSTLTHLPSSVSLVTNVRIPIADQDPILQELATTMDWSKSYDEILSFWLHNQPVYEKVRALFAKLRGDQA